MNMNSIYYSRNSDQAYAGTFTTCCCLGTRLDNRTSTLQEMSQGGLRTMLHKRLTQADFLRTFLRKIFADMKHEECAKLRVLTNALFVIQKTKFFHFETVFIDIGFCIFYLL